MSISKPTTEYYLISGRWVYRGDSPHFLVCYVLAGRVRRAYASAATSYAIHAAVITRPVAA